MSLWADRWSSMHRWWSLRLGVVGTILVAGLPALADQVPDLKQVLLGWFPENGAQWVPALCIAVVVAARVISQAAVIEALRRMFGKKESDDAV